MILEPLLPVARHDERSRRVRTRVVHVVRVESGHSLLAVGQRRVVIVIRRLRSVQGASVMILPGKTGVIRRRCCVHQVVLPAVLLVDRPAVSLASVERIAQQKRPLRRIITAMVHPERVSRRHMNAAVVDLDEGHAEAGGRLPLRLLPSPIDDDDERHQRDPEENADERDEPGCFDDSHQLLVAVLAVRQLQMTLQRFAIHGDYVLSMSDPDTGTGLRSDRDFVRHPGHEMKEGDAGGAFVGGYVSIELRRVAEDDDLEAAEESVDFFRRWWTPGYPQSRHVHHPHANVRSGRGGS